MNARKIQVDEELKPNIVFAMADKIKTMVSYILRERQNVGDNSYKQLESAYYALKNAVDYMNIGE